MLIREVLLFGLSGLVGFLVDASVLTLLLSSLGPHSARLVSFMAAVFTTWLMNRRHTFRHRPSAHALPIEFLAYLGSMMAGGSINLATYALLIETAPFARMYPIFGVALGSLAGMAVNFILSRSFIFKKRHHLKNH